MVYLLGNHQSTVFIDFIVNHIQTEAVSSSQMVMIWKQAALLKSSCCCFFKHFVLSGDRGKLGAQCNRQVLTCPPGLWRNHFSPVSRTGGGASQSQTFLQVFLFSPPSYSDCSVQRINPFPPQRRGKKRFLQTGLKPSIKQSISLTEKVYFQP